MAFTRKRKEVSLENPAIIQTLTCEIVSSSSYLALNKTMLKTYGPNTAVVLSYMVERQKYMNKKHPENEGWFFLLREKLAEDTGLSVFTVQQIKKQLISDGVLIVKRKGLPSKEWFQINYFKIAETTGLVDLSIARLADTKTARLADAKTARLYIEKNNKPRNIVNQKEKDIFVAHAFSLAEKLSGIIRSKKKINHTPSQIKGWAKSINKLVTQVLTDGEDKSIQRVSKALDWYSDNIGLPYVPVIESGQSLLEKFAKLEAAMERDKPNSPNPARKGVGKFAGVKKIELEDDDD